MWRSSRRTSCSRAAARRGRPCGGFSLVELLVSLAIFLIVIMVPMYLLFTMRNYAERQQYTIVPRQAARRALDYMSYYIEGATDLNSTQNNPNSIVVYFNSDASVAGSRQQASYNNLTQPQSDAGYGDEGTDIITVAIPTNPIRIPIALWPSTDGAAAISLAYRGGCGGLVPDTDNMNLFKTITGGSAAATRSNVLTAVDATGEWQYVVITAYTSSDCSAAASSTGTNITVQVSPGVAPGAGGPIDPPGGHSGLSNPVSLMLGVQYVSFRVRNGNLEQKNGIFFPVDIPNIGTADTPGTAFFPIMENVEDLQVAYMYNDGTIWNTKIQTINGGAGSGCTNCNEHVPWQKSTGLVTAEPLDISNVTGLRLNIVARSAPMSLGVKKMTSRPAAPHFRPEVEDHPAGTPDNFEHYRITTTLMLRNRMLGS